MKNKLFFSAMLVSLLAFGLTISSCAPSAAKQAIISAPSVEDVKGLDNKLTWLKSNAKSGGDYVLEITANEKLGGLISFPGSLSYKDKSDITITLKGIGANRTISRGQTISGNEPGSIFIVGSGVTLVLDDNITLQGFKIINAVDAPKTSPLVSVSSGGTLVMNDGSAITGNQNNSSNGGGVRVSGGGTFIMKGGTIYGNDCFPVTNVVLAAASKGKYTAYTEEHYKGGGVYVSGESNLFGKITPSGTFTKTGGTITGYSGQEDSAANIVREFNGKSISQNSGHAVYLGGSKGESKSIDTTIGPEVSFHFSNGKFSEIQNEEPKREEVVAEPEDDISPDSSETLEE